MQSTAAGASVEILMTTEDLAAWFQVHPNTIRQKVDREGLPAIRFGPKKFRFKRAEVEAWLESRSTRSEKPGPNVLEVDFSN